MAEHDRRPKKLRASHADRRRATDILATALREGRLDALEHETRSASVRSAKSIGELDRLLADLPRRLGVRDWAGHLRIRLADRDVVTRWLAAAQEEGRVSSEEHEQRLAALASAGTYADLPPVLDGVPGPPDVSREDLLVSDADRQSALDRLSQAVQDGQLTLDEQENLQSGVRRAERYRQLDEFTADLDELDERIEDSPPRPERRAERPRRETRRYRRLAVAGAAVVAAVVVVTLIMRSGGGDHAQGGAAVPATLSVAWSAPFDRPSGVVTMSSWIAGDLLIRARTDKIVASALADGRESWVFAFPRGNQLCTMSRGIEDNIGIVGYKSDDESHCITMVALDLATGRKLWQRQRGPLPPVPFRTDVDEIAVAGQVALSRESSGFTAVDLHDGKLRWRKAAAGGCEVYSVAAEGDTAVLLSVCKNHTLALVVADVASGRERWHAQLDISADDETSMGYGAKATTVLSVDPLVIRASDDGGTGGAFVSFDAQGRRLATISQSQQDVDLAPGQFPKRGARAQYLTDVVGDVLVTPARKVGDSADHLLTAYSITDGRRLWSTEFQEPVTLVVATADKVFVKQDGSPLAVYALALHDGRILQKRTFETDQDKVADTVAYAADLRVDGDSYVFIGERGETAAPVVVLR